MSNARHTPGPWKAQLARSGSNRLQVSGPSGRQVCALWRHGPKETEANRDLITAAPDLLEALKNLVRYLDETDVDGMTYRAEQMIAAHNAIAKAEGKEGN